MKIGAAGGATALGVSGQLPDQIDPTRDAEAGIVTVGAAITVLAVGRYVLNNYGGRDDQYNAIAFEDHLNIYNDAIEIAEVTDEELLASLTRDATHLQDTARESAIIKMYEAVATGASRSQAQADAEAAINEVFAKPEKALATRVNSILNGIFVEADSRGVLRARSDSGTTTPETGSFPRTGSYTFLNGDSSEITYHHNTDSNLNLITKFDPFGLSSQTGDPQYDELAISAPDPADYDGVDGSDYDLSHVDGTQKLVSHAEYSDLITKINDSAQAVLDEVEALLSTHYDGISAGDLSLSQMLSTQAMLDTVADATSWQEAALYFRSVGIPEATEPCRVSFDLSEVESVDGDSATNTTNTSDGSMTETATFDGKLGWSLSDEVEGNSLPVGSTIDPTAYPGSIYLAVEWEDADGNMQADVVQLTDPFTIEATNSGASSLEFESRKVATADTSPEEARDIFIQNRESEEQARDQTIEVVIDDGSGPIVPNDWGPSWLPDWMPKGQGAILALLAGVITIPAVVKKILPY